MARFKLVRVMMGSGWPSGHVAVDEHYTFPGKAGGGELFLTLDAETADELGSEIDELIDELKSIKASSADSFSRWQADWRAGRDAKHAG